MHEAIVRCLARELADEWLAVYHANKTDGYRVEHAEIAKRALRNVCLGYRRSAKMWRWRIGW